MDDIVFKKLVEAENAVEAATNKVVLMAATSRAAVVTGVGSDPVVRGLHDYLLSPEGEASFAASGFCPPSEAAR